MNSDKPLIELKSTRQVIIENTLFSETLRLSDGSVINFELRTASSSLDITKCNFTNCKSTTGSGGAIAGNIGHGKLSVTECRFTECTSKTEGGAIYIRSCNAFENQFILKCLTFDACSTNSQRGGHCLYITNWDRKKYPITTNNFALLKGVTDNPKSILLTDENGAVDNSFSISEIPSSKECIVAIYVDASGGNTYDGSEENPKKTLSGAVSALSEDDIVFVIHSAELTEEWKICGRKAEIYPSETNTQTYVNISGTGSLANDDATDADTLLTFSNLIFQWEASVTATPSFASISLGSLSFESCSFTFRTVGSSSTYSDALFSLLDKGEGKHGGKLSLNKISITGIDWSSNTFVKTTTGQLALANVEFDFEGKILQKSSFICCESGTQTFSMKNCKFKNVSIQIGSGAMKNSMTSSSPSSSLNAGTEVSNEASNSPFIAINAASSVSIEGCIFSTVSSPSSLSGGALSITIPASSSSPFLTIHNSTFSSCEASEANGRGGAVYLSLTGSSTTNANSIKLTQLIFTNNKAAKGIDIYIMYAKLKTCISDWNWSDTTKPEMTLNALFGCETSSPSPSDSIEEFSLYPFFFQLSDKSVNVDSSNGINEDEGNVCCCSQWSCSTLLKALNRLSSIINVVKIVAKLSVNTAVDLNLKTFFSKSSFFPSTSKSSVKEAIDSGFECDTASDSGPITFESLSINLANEGAPSTVKALLSQTTGNITISSCNFSEANAQTKKNFFVNLAVLTGGKFALQQTNIQNMSFSSEQAGGSIHVVLNKKSTENPIYSTTDALQNSTKGNSSSSNDKNSESVLEGSRIFMIAFLACAATLALFVFIATTIIVCLRKKLARYEEIIFQLKGYIQFMEENFVRNDKMKKRKFEIMEMPSTLTEGMTNQIPMLVGMEEEELPIPPELGNPTNEEENAFQTLPSPPVIVEEESTRATAAQSIKVFSTKMPFLERTISDARTLYDELHSIQGDFTLGTRSMAVVDEKEVVLGVAKLFACLIKIRDERVLGMAANLCPFTIFIDKRKEGNNEVLVMSEEEKNEMIMNAMKRWKAPEENNGDANEVNEREIDGIEKSVVFTLGLILHEMIAGEVPLSECNEEEACEMIRDGVRPLTEGIEGEELIELMEKMWENDPKDRPFLDEVIEKLTSLMQIGEGEH
ncbi:uncharacterized protein MONOS_8510 [Monocercomonoides exilis]|uniref:uncharacterized protein n=1 Tax=Monocercomonoides exilis TaxID=2049356 RepID=UPI00355A3B8C|nr:hypothetical protein MONOS_8510 [Monocercomonoides exilis]|eukprot:MONOS_8510.1-p1 / transcript=MONOS_8510.1 / gene=MONOS_8510 / organism=Monocercomonoides_exilis_PA203 / gene_product=unspecified product / transcript_product=unspecified product / location=Mono_scaffold00322:60066-63539(-) / protein_length=1157 / sequence_SO=supercontig / SO=protein_coding / is_pseudo=false